MLLLTRREISYVLCFTIKKTSEYDKSIFDIPIGSMESLYVHMCTSDTFTMNMALADLPLKNIN